MGEAGAIELTGIVKTNREHNTMRIEVNRPRPGTNRTVHQNIVPLRINPRRPPRCRSQR